MPISEHLRAVRAKLGHDLLAPWARIVVPAALENRGRSVMHASTWQPPR